MDFPRMLYFITRQKTVSRKASPNSPPRYGEDSTYEDTLGNWLVYLFLKSFARDHPSRRPSLPHSVPENQENLKCHRSFTFPRILLRATKLNRDESKKSVATSTNMGKESEKI